MQKKLPISIQESCAKCKYFRRDLAFGNPLPARALTPRAHSANQQRAAKNEAEVASRHGMGRVAGNGGPSLRLAGSLETCRRRRSSVRKGLTNMKPREPTPLLSGAAALEAEVRARIDRDEAEIAAELGETPLPGPVEDELARQREKERKRSPGRVFVRRDEG